MTSHADQRPANSNWFEFLWSASPFSSILVQPDIPAAPCALRLFHPCTISHSLIPLRFLLLYTLFPHPAAHPSAFLLLHHSLTAHQCLSPGVQLYICTLMCSLVSIADQCYTVCRADCLLIGKIGRRKEQSKQSPGLQSMTGPLQVTVSVSWYWELKRRGVQETCEMRATVEPGQHWTWATVGRFKHNFPTENKMAMITNCRLQM